MTTLLRRILGGTATHASLSHHLPFSTSSRRTPHRFRRSRRAPNPAPPSPDAVSAAVASLPSRLTPPLLASSLASASDPRLVLPLLTHSLRLPAFRPDPAPFLVAIKRLAAADLYADFDRACALSFSLLPSLPSPGPLLRAALYFYCQFRRLGKAFHVYTLMRASADPAARPSADTYHALFTALLSRGGGDTMVHYMYMDTISALFRQMLEEGVTPDTRSLNVLVKGYAQSLHLNDALRVFHQMGPLYGCEPDAFTYSYLVHGLSAQGRTNNAREVFDEMRGKGLVPTEPACNAFVSALAMAGEVGEAERVMWEMARAGRVVDDITRRAVVEELWRAEKREDAERVVKEMEERGIVGGAERRALLRAVHDEYGDDGLYIDDRGRSTRKLSEHFSFWGTPEGDVVHPAECMHLLLEQVRCHKVNIDGNVCTVMVTTLVLEGWQRKLDPDYNVMKTLQTLLFKEDWAKSLQYTIEGLMTP